MRKYLTMLLVVGVILTTVISGSVFAADGDVIGYEWNGTGTGWAFAESTLDFTSEDITKDAAGFTLPTGYKSKIVLFNTVTDWSDSYNFSFDVKIGGYNAGSKASIFFNCKDQGTNYELELSASGYIDSYFKLKETVNWSTTLLGDGEKVIGPYIKPAYWHIDISYNNGNIVVKGTPADGEEIELFNVTDDSPRANGKIAFLANSTTHSCTFSNIKIEKNISDEATNDFAFDGNNKGWLLDDGLTDEGEADPTEGVWTISDNKLVADTSTSNSKFAVYNAVNWKDSYEYSYYVDFDGYNTSAHASTCFNYQDRSNYYRFAITGYPYGTTNGKATLSVIKNGSIAKTFEVTGLSGKKYDVRVKYDNGNIKVWTTPTGGTESLMFDVNESDFGDGVPTYSSGKIGFISHMLDKMNVSNIIINGAYEIADGTRLCCRTPSCVTAAADGLIKTVAFSEDMTGDISVTIPVKYAVESGSKEAWVIIGQYDGDQLMDIEIVKQTIDAADGWQDVVVDVTCSGDYTTRIFIWASNLMPAFEM